MADYVGARYTIKIYENSLDPSSAEWESGFYYEPLTMVTYNNSTYLSRIAVPATVGTPDANGAYWVLTGAYNGQIMALDNRITAIETDLTPTGYVNTDIVYHDCTFSNGGYNKESNIVSLSITVTIDTGDAGTKKIMDIPASIKPSVIISAVAQDITGEIAPIFCSITPSGEVFAKNTTTGRRYTITASWIL